MIIPDKVRNYEVSIWTLQDSFITVLKQFNLDNREKIQEPSMTLKDDGENTFSFKIPMYILQNGEFKENPIWYTTRNGNIIADMRKVKVIFEKKTEKEQVFEFIITKVTERHEGFSKICEVECEGLAFHELGKQGYLISLTEDDFLAEHEDWVKSGQANEEPIANINYWVEKVLKNSTWNYLICMDWSSQDGVLTFKKSNSEEELIDNIRYINDENYRRSVDTDRVSKSLRDKQKIYREPYVSSWNVNSNKLVPATIVNDLADLEKKAILNEANSNRYNLLQSIAEAFQVFCKFVYGYDDNYHIISRTVVFFNNFISESEGALDFNYGHNTQSISREMDSNDLVTKMYIEPVNDSGLVNGEINISDSAANKSLENYLLNFDYMYNIGTISQEQYDEVPQLLAKLRTINKAINDANDQITKAKLDLPIIEAQLQTAEDGITEAKDRLTEATAYLDSLTGSSELPEYTINNPLRLTLIHGDLNYVNISIAGVKADTLRFFKTLVSGAVDINSEIINSNFSIKRDSVSKNINRVVFKSGIGLTATTDSVFAVFKFDPDTAYKEVKKICDNKIKRDTKIIADLTSKKTKCENTITGQNNIINQKTKEKEELLAKFERLMGPALREGYWQPEDSYSDYQAFKSLSTTISVDISSNAEAGLFWDENIHEDEQDGIFEYGLDQTKRYYPCILLDNNTKINAVKNNFDDLFLIYKNSTFTNDLRDNHYVSLKANGEIIFLKNGTTVTPALIITDDELIALDPLPVYVKLSTVTGYDDKTNVITEGNAIVSWINQSPWLTLNRSSYKTVYPRFYIKSKNFISDSQENKVFSGSTQLEENEDYYILYDYVNSQNNSYSQWTVTIKPLVFLKQNYSSSTYTLKYTLSTAADAIFLDAQEVMKENSTPKVSYEITPLAKDVDLIKYAYNRIGQLAHINDHELKFKNVMGYISEVNLDLDKPWEDTYVVKNYKTKFEDLFSSIVAQTEAMKKNSQVIGLATNLIDTNGNLKSDLLLDALGRVDLSKIMERYTFSAAGIRAIEDKAALANSVAYKIINGEVGLAFPKSSTIDNVILNNEVGLKIEGVSLGTSKTSFRVTNDAMGFFKGNTAMLYFDSTSGDMALAGTIFAKNGWFGGERGWIISDGTNGLPTFSSVSTLNSSNDTKNISDMGGLLYSANGKVLIAAGSDSKQPFMGFYAGNNGTTPKFIFDGTDVYLNGRITTSAGSIGGWKIGSNYIGSGSTRPTSKVGITVSSNDGTLAFWAGADTTTTGTSVTGYKFGVTQAGYLTSTSGKIANWTIATYQLSSGSGTTYVALNSGAKDSTNNPNGDYAIWAGNTAPASAPFSVTKDGEIKSTSGAIGGWTIDSDSIYTGTKTDTTSIRLSSTNFSRLINNVSRSSLRLAFGTKFGVASDGTLYASGATISGAITATSGTFTGTINARSGTIGSENAPKITLGSSGDTSTSVSRIYSGTKSTLTSNTLDGFYLGTDGLALGKGLFKVTSAGAVTANSITIGSGNDTLTYTSSGGLVVKGSVTATKGTIGGWTIGDGILSYSSTTPSSSSIILKPAGVTSSTSIGGSSGSKTWAFTVKDKFGVDTSGNLYATGADITGIINADSGVIGTTTANQIILGDGIIRHQKETLTDSKNGFFISKDGIAVGPNSSFKVTSGGILNATSVKITGEITASNLNITDDAFNWTKLNCPEDDENINRFSSQYKIYYGKLGSLVIVRGSCVAEKNILNGGTICEGLPLPNVNSDAFQALPSVVGTFDEYSTGHCSGVFYANIWYVQGLDSTIEGTLEIEYHEKFKGSFNTGELVHLTVNLMYVI